MKRLLFLLLLLPVTAFGQFRMVSSGVTVTSTVDDSTYVIDVDFFPDQTAKGYFATGITTSYRVFSQTGQLYSISSISSPTLSSITLTIVEIDNNYVDTELAPVGQILVFNPQGEYITYTPFGNSNMGQVLQQAIGTYNAVVSSSGTGIAIWDSTATYEPLAQVSQGGKIYTNKTGTNTSTLPGSDPVNWEITNKSAITDDIDGRDTISQASHGFSIGDPLWYSGDFILAQDTGLSVRVDGIVVEVIDVNTFVRQRSGKFTLSSHGFTNDIQLYIQPDGSYSGADTSNSLIYGYAVNASEIQIGAKTGSSVKAVRGVFATVINPYGGSNEIGAVIQDIADNIFPYNTKYDKRVSNIIVDPNDIANKDKYTLVIKNDTIGEITSVTLPNPVDSLLGKTISIVDSSTIAATTYLIATERVRLKYIDQYCDRYYLDKNEVVDLVYTDSTITIQNTETKFKTYKDLTDISNNRFFEGQEFLFKGGRYAVQKSLSAYGSDNLFVIPVKEKTPYGENLILNSEEIIHVGAGIGQWNISDAIRPAFPFIGKDLEYGLDGEKDADALIADAAGTKRISQLINFKDLGLELGDKVTYSFWVKVAQASSNDNVAIASVRFTPFGSTEISEPGFTPNVTDKQWEQVVRTFTMTQAIDTLVSVFTYFTMDIGDTLYVTRAQLERTPSSSPYKVTTTNPVESSDTSYAILQTYDNILDLNRLYRGVDVTDIEILRTAVNYCKTTGLCNKIKVFDGMVLTDTLLLPEFMHIIGDGSDNTEVFVALNDDTKSAIFCERGSTMAQGQGISGIKFTPISDAFAIINANNALEQYYFDISINGTYDVGVDSVNYGIYIGSITGEASIYSHIESSNITGFGVANIHYENCGNLHELKDVISSRGKIGIQGSATILKIDFCDIESNEIALDLYDFGQVEATNSYIENGQCKISNALIFSYKEGRISGGGFEITDVNNIELSRNRLSSGAFVYESSTNTIKPAVVITNNWFENTTDYHSMRSKYCDTPGSQFYGNFSDTETFPNGCVDGLRIHNSSFTDIALYGNNFYGDTMIISDSTYLVGLKQNLWPKSDSIFNVDGILSGEVEIENNVTLAPDGTMTADRYIGLANTSGTAGFNAIPLGETIETGDVTIVSVWAKAESHNPTTKLVFRYGATETNQIGPFYSTEWKRYDIVMSPATADVTSITRRRTSTSVGDSILFWGWQVNRGEKLLSYQPTTGTSLNTTGPARFKTPNGVQFIGAVLNVDSLKLNHVTPTNGDTIPLYQEETVIYLGSGDTVYLDESGYNHDARITIIQSSGIGTILKADGLSNRFYELGTDRSYSKVIGTGSAKTLFYRKSTNHWYTDTYYQADVPIEDVTTTTDTVRVYRGMEIAMDGTSGSYTVQLDLADLNEGEAFSIKVNDAGASTVTIDVLNEGSVVQYEGDTIATTKGFTGSYFYVHCSWRGGVLYMTR